MQPKLSKTRTIMKADNTEDLGYYNFFSSLYGFIVSILPMKTHKCSEIGPRKNAGVRSVRDILRQGRSSVPSGAYMVDREALRKARAKVPKGEYHVDLLQFDLSIKIPTAETCVRSNL